MSLTAIVSVLGGFFALLTTIAGAWALLQSRIKALEVEHENLKERMKDDSTRYERFKQEIRSDIDKLYERIDEIKTLIIDLKK